MIEFTDMIMLVYSNVTVTVRVFQGYYRRRAAAPYTPLRYASLTYDIRGLKLGLATIGSANWKTYKLTF